jgi:hypothetical protein
MTDDPSPPDERWKDEFLREHGFPCGHYDFQFFPDPVVVAQVGKDVPYGFVDRILVDYLREDLLEILSPEIANHLTFGRVMHTSHGELTSLTTIWSPRRVRIRAGKKSDCWQCEECGQVIYNPRGYWYVLASDLTDAPLFFAKGGIIVNEELYQRLKGCHWKKVDIRKLTVLDKPRDGFPADLSTITPEQERKWTPPRT